MGRCVRLDLAGPPVRPVSRAYALSDGNSLYWSCERVFDASLKTKPVIVPSNNDGFAVARTLSLKFVTPIFMAAKTIGLLSLAWGASDAR